MRTKAFALIGLGLLVSVLLVLVLLNPPHALSTALPTRTPTLTATPSHLRTPGGPTPAGVKKPSRVVDLAPNLPLSEKVQWVVRSPNGDRYYILTPPGMERSSVTPLLGPGDVIENTFLPKGSDAIPHPQTPVNPGAFPPRTPGTPIFVPPTETSIR